MWFNKRHEKEGNLWEDKFKSVLVEDGHAARVVAAYIDLNPVRAGIVGTAEDYRWSGWGEAAAGKTEGAGGDPAGDAGAGAGEVGAEVALAEVSDWGEVWAGYRA